VATLHQKLAVVIVLAALGGAIWSGYSAYKRLYGPRLRAAGWAAAAAIAVQALAGSILALAGNRPAEPWHFVFGPVTLLALPVAMLAGRGRSPRTESLLVFAGWLVTFGLSLRAVGTGGFAA
jgi:hypothetical protein